jgi:hypothetical protein
LVAAVYGVDMATEGPRRFLLRPRMDQVSEGGQISQ